MNGFRFALAWASFAALSCSREGPEPGADARIRLVDLVATARFETAADHADREAFAAATTRVLANASGAEVARLAWKRFAVDAGVLADGRASGPGPVARPVKPALRAGAARGEFDGPSVALLPIETTGDRDHVVEIGFDPIDRHEPTAARDGIVVFELDAARLAEGLGDVTDVIAMFARDRGVHRFGDRTGGRVEFRTAPETSAVVIAILSLRGGAIDRLHVSRRTRLGGLLEHPIAIAGDPRAQRVLVGDERREALVLAAPGSVRFERKLPRRASRLRAAVAPVDWIAPDAPPPVVRMEVKRGSARAHAEISLARGTWSELEIDLSPHAGEPVAIEFTCPGTGTGKPLGIAIGTPVIDVARTPARPDVLLISLDTLRYDRTSIAGYPAPTTPRLQRLAEESGVFRRAFAPAAFTLPSHATIFSGRLPDAHRVIAPASRYDAADDALLAVAFRAAGYVTAGFTAGGYVRPEFGLARGLETYRLDDPGRPEWREEHGPFTELTNESLRRLERFLAVERSAPAFVFVHTYAAHDYWAPRELAQRLGDPGDAAWDALDPAASASLRERARDGVLDDETKRRIGRLYDAGARLADEALGRVLDLFAASGRLDDTLIVVVSDHGEELLERGRIGHGFSVYDEMLRVPFLVKGPGIVPGEHRTIVSLADVAPTIREFARIPEPIHPVDGRSLLPLLRGGSLPEIGAYARILGEGDTAVRALRGSRHKLRVAGDPLAPREVVLHDLARDPGETADAASQQPRVAEAMLDALRRVHREQTERRRTPIESVMSAETIRQLRELGYLDVGR